MADGLGRDLPPFDIYPCLPAKDVDHGVTRTAMDVKYEMLTHEGIDKFYNLDNPSYDVSGGAPWQMKVEQRREATGGKLRRGLDGHDARRVENESNLDHDGARAARATGCGCSSTRKL